MKSRKAKNRREAKFHCDKHHVYPRSRKKKGDLGKFKAILGSLRLCTEIKTHASWHHIFGRLFPEEVLAVLKAANRAGLVSAPEIISFIKYFLQPRRAIASATGEDLDAWRKIFGEHASFRAIRKIIIRNWTYPGVKATVSGKKIVKVVAFLPKVPKKERFLEDVYRCRNVRLAFLKDGRLLKIS